MSVFQSIVVRQPEPFDVVGDSVGVCGLGTAFEGRFAARLRDADGKQLQQLPIETGGTGIWGNFQIELGLSTIPSTAQGTVEVFELSPRDGTEMNKSVVPVVFGSVLIEPYNGFTQHSVRPGDSLSSIAEQFYGDEDLWNRIFEANRHQTINPDRVFVGQMLRVPQ